MDFNYDDAVFVEQLNLALLTERILTAEVNGANLSISSPSTLLTLTGKHGLEVSYGDESLKDTDHELLVWSLIRPTDGSKKSVIVMDSITIPVGLAN